MSKREIIHRVLNNKKPQYVPWSFSFTKEALEKLKKQLNDSNIEDYLDNHFLELGNAIGFFNEIDENLYQDVFGVIWDRRVDNHVLKEPTLQNYEFPDPCDERFFKNIPSKIKIFSDRFRVFQIGFSLYERAWSLRGMERLLMDFYEYPSFVHNLFNTIADYNIEQIKVALKYDIDAIYFGDDWGHQTGLQMGPDLWKKFIYPV